MVSEYSGETPSGRPIANKTQGRLRCRSVVEGEGGTLGFERGSTKYLGNNRTQIFTKLFSTGIASRDAQDDSTV